MKGTSTFTEAAHGGHWSEAGESDGSMSDWEREERRQIEMAITLSLEDDGGAMDQDVPAADPVVDHRRHAREVAGVPGLVGLIDPVLHTRRRLPYAADL